MNTWKLSINIGKVKDGAFYKCKDKSLVGIGWSGSYENQQPNDYADAERLIKDRFGKMPKVLKRFMEEIRKGDHVWLHKNGKYYLCEIEDEHLIYGKDIDSNFLEYDLGHAKTAKWVEIPSYLVSGKIQRGVIAQRMLQRINVTKEELDYNQFIFKELSSNPKWNPVIDESKLSSLIKGLSEEAIFDLMTPDDVEDVIASYLQSKERWVITKSTCFRSKPTYEFSMLNKKGEKALVQVKSGSYPDPLAPSNYEKDTTNNTYVYLFSTNKSPYPGSQFPNVRILEKSEIFKWVVQNMWSLTYPLKLKLWVVLTM